MDKRECPICGEEFNFEEAVFQELYNTDFDMEYGVEFITVFCPKCNASWCISVSEVSTFTVKEEYKK